LKFTVRQKENIEIWEARFARARDRSGSLEEFCKAEGVAPSLYSYWKSKLAREAKSLTRSRSTTIDKKISSFDRVEVLESSPLRSQIPSAKWVAEFILHLHKGIAT